MRFLIAPVKGDEELWVVFWIYAVLVYGIAMMMQLAFAFNPPNLSPTMNSVVGWGSTIIGYIYTIWINISLWQCAFNTESKSAPYWIRAGVILTILFTITSLFFDNYGQGMLDAALNANKSGGTDPELEQLQKILETLQKQK